MAKNLLDLGPATAYIEENSTTDEKTKNIKVSRAAYKGFMEERGVSEAVLQQTAEAHSHLYGGMLMTAGQRLARRVEEAKEAGNDPSAEVQRLEVSRLDGTAIVDISAKKTSPNPRFNEHGGDEHIVKYGAASLKLRMKTQIPGQAIDAVSTMMRHAMGEEDAS